MDKIEIPNKIKKELLKKKNVIGYSTSTKMKTSNGKTQPIPCLRVYVTKKEELSKLDAKDVVPSILSLGSNEICTDVVEIGEIKALNQNDCGICSSKSKVKKKADEWIFKPGCSSAHKDCTACTTNMRFIDKNDGKDIVASNNHCYALENKASKGDAILSPSPYDGGKYPDNIVGYLKKFVEIKFNDFTCPYRNALHRLYRKVTKSAVPENKVDIGFIELKEGTTWDDKVVTIGQCNGKTVAKIGDKAFKHGRTTGYTDNGDVVDLDWVGSIGYSRGQVLFSDCILIEKTGFCAGGDSGSSVFVRDNLYIGALFAGSSTHTIVCKINNIEAIANVELPVEWK